MFDQALRIYANQNVRSEDAEAAEEGAAEAEEEGAPSGLEGQAPEEGEEGVDCWCAVRSFLIF